MADKRLRVVLRIAGLGCMTGVFGVALPFGWLNEWLGMMGLGEIPAGPLPAYAVRGVAATFVFVGVYFLLLAGDPVRYAPFLTLSIAALLAIGTVCLITGATTGMRPAWYLTDVAFCWVLGLLMLLWRKPAPTASEKGICGPA
jgi:hypothetical protein